MAMTLARRLLRGDVAGERRRWMVEGGFLRLRVAVQVEKAIVFPGQGQSSGRVPVEVLRRIAREIGEFLDIEDAVLRLGIYYHHPGGPAQVLGP